jgi:hypothetical protein
MGQVQPIWTTIADRRNNGIRRSDEASDVSESGEASDTINDAFSFTKYLAPHATKDVTVPCPYLGSPVHDKFRYPVPLYGVEWS